MAQPHVQSMATSAANALKVAAEDSVDKLRGCFFLLCVCVCFLILRTSSRDAIEIHTVVHPKLNDS